MTKRKRTNSTKRSRSKDSGHPSNPNEPKSKRKRKATARQSSLKKQTANKSNQQSSNTDSESQPESFPIVGVGASAGGLKALQSMFESLPDDSGLAFVVIQHLDPTKKSLTSELLGKHTGMRVTQVEDDPRVKPNHVYVIPPNKYLSISGGELHLSEPDTPRRTRMAIDFFLRSLAQDQGPRAVAVILSGTGTDGTLGIKAVKGAGGLVVAQDLSSAEFGGMPRSAINSGIVDHILPPDKMSESLVQFALHPYVRETKLEMDTSHDEPASAVEPEQENGFDSIISLLRHHSKRDFRSYKDKTLVRRTRRRMCLNQIDEYEIYLEYLKTHPEEIEALAKDLLISVTDFFREPEAWEQLRETCIEPLVRDKGTDDPIRIWVPGCATGEEPYSIAMLVLEELKQANKNCPLQVFASDLAPDAIEYARHGRYPKSIEADVSRERLAKFFAAEANDDYYRVTKMMRESVVFADQNLIADPPFSKLDLVCCRNLLIYLKPEVQEKVIAMFHFALLEGGTLMLGSAETIGRQTDLFRDLDKRWRIFQRIGPTRHDRVEIPLTSASSRPENELALPQVQHREARLARLAQHRLLDSLGLTAVLIDRHWRVRYICGDVDDYLIRKSGTPSDNLLENVRRGLRTKLRGAVRTAISQNRTVSAQARVLSPGGYVSVAVTVRVVKDRDQVQDDLLLVDFKKLAEPSRQQSALSNDQKQTAHATASTHASLANESDLDDDVVVRQLEEELAEVRDDLQATIEQLETSNEEFRASNEEVMSVNEELQSTNEELETSKEELQSLNEELSTVNSELGSKVDELETKHADLENLLAVTDVPTICLDRDLAVRWFTPAAQTVIRLRPADLGRPLEDFADDFTDGNLVDISKRVLAKLILVEDEVGCHDGRTYLRRVHPYRTPDHRINGVVIMFIDITTRKRNEQEVVESKELSDLLIDTLRDATLVLNDSLQVVHANHSFYEKFQVEQHQTEGCLIYDLGNHQWDIPELRELLENVLPANQHFHDFVVDHEFESIGRRTMILNGRRIGRRKQILLAIEDVSELRAVNEALEQQTSLLGLLQDVTGISNKAQSFDEAVLAAMERICRFNRWQVGHVWRRAYDDPQNLVATNIWYVSPHAELAVGKLEEFQQICEQHTFSVGEFDIGTVATTGDPLWIDNIVQSSDWQRGDAESLGLHAFIAFPITANNEVVAVLEFFSDHPTQCDSSFLEIMPDVGIQLGHLKERKRLERLAAEAVESEQRRIGSDIHDGLGQEMAGLRYMTWTHVDKLSKQSSPETDTAERISQGLESLQHHIRRVIHELTPVEIEEFGLVAVLQTLAEHVSEIHELECLFESSESIRVADSTLATHLYRIAQEAIRNAVQHGQASKILIGLQQDDHELRLEVDDNGVGINPDRTSQDGYGLRSMEYRCGLIGGRFECHPKLDGGTRVTCTIAKTGLTW